MKAISPSKELLYEGVTPLSLDISATNLSSPSTNLLSPFATMGDSSPPASRPLFSSDRTPPTSPKSEDEGLKMLTKFSKRDKTSRSLDEISRVQLPARNPYVSPTLRPKSISLHPSHQMVSNISGQLKENQFKEVISSDNDSIVPCQTSGLSYPTKASQSVQISSSSAQDDRQSDVEHINQQITTMFHPEESSSSRLSNNKDLVKSKVNIICFARIIKFFFLNRTIAFLTIHIFSYCAWALIDLYYKFKRFYSFFFLIVPYSPWRIYYMAPLKEDCTEKYW